MDPLFLSRLQFGLTVGFHYIFPAVTIGMAWLIVWMLSRARRTGDPEDRSMARLWIRIFALTFAIGVATGIVMEFQFGMNWAPYSRFVGDIFGAPLAAEGILAFFLESTFLGVLIFGERRVSAKAYWFSSLMVAVGSTFSGFWIIVANSWQQTPAGFTIVNGRAELADFWAAVFNPSTVPRFLHTIDGALMGGAFFVAGLSSYLLLRGKHIDFARKSLVGALVLAFATSLLQLPLGHLHAVQVARTQPVKLAAFEGLWETQTDAPLLAFGLPNPEQERTDFAVSLPGLLSIGVGGDRATQVQGLRDFPKDEWPPLRVTFLSFHAMVGLGMYFIALSSLGMLLWWRKRLFDSRFYLAIMAWSLPLPIVANELGWIAAEVGRQPWIVYGLLRTEAAFSQVVPAAQILISLVGFSLIYALLFGVWVYVLRKKLLAGPEATQEATQGGCAG